MTALLRWAALAALLVSQLGCATVPPGPVSPQLRLSPASLGKTLALQQQLTVTVAGQTHRVEVLLEADPQAVRVAVLSLGQTAARLEWDGVHLTQSRASWWPDAISAERILDDMQLMLWPAAAVSAGLPPGWSLASSEALRVLSRDGQAVVQVIWEAPNVSELVHLRQGYRVRVESHVLEAAQ